MSPEKIGGDFYKFFFCFVVVSSGRIRTFGFVPEMRKFLTASFPFCSGNYLIAVDLNPNRFQVSFSELFLAGSQDADNFIRSDQLLG